MSNNPHVSADGRNMSVGGEKHRDDSSWSARSDNWHQGHDATPTPAAPEAKPADGEGGTPLFEGFEPDQVDGFRDTLARGLMPPEALQRAYGLSDRELAALVEGKATVSKAASEVTKPAGTAALQAELQAIRELRKSDPQAYWRHSNQQRELEILQALNAEKAGAAEDAPLRDFVDAVRAGIPNPANLESTFNEMFPQLEAEAQELVRQEVAHPTSPTRSATDAEVAAFAERPEGKQLIAEWGKRAPERIAKFQTRLKAMARADKSGKLANWFGERTTDEAASIARALAR